MAALLDIRCQWRAHLVGALRVHPHKHYVNYPPKKDRGFARDARRSQVEHPAIGGPADDGEEIDRGAVFAPQAAIPDSQLLKNFGAAYSPAGEWPTDVRQPAGIPADASGISCEGRSLSRVPGASRSWEWRNAGQAVGSTLSDPPDRLSVDTPGRDGVRIGRE